MSEKKTVKKKRIGFMALMRSFFLQFNENSSAMLSNGMVYSTLIALVPCIAVVYAILSQLNVLDPVAGALSEYVLSTFGEKTGETLVSYINTFTENAVSMGIVSMLSFAVTFVLLIDKIFVVVNKIYKTRQTGNPVIRYLKYIGIIAVGIAAIVVAVFLLGRFNSLSIRLRKAPALSALQIFWKNALPIASMFGVLLAMIILIPNCAVNFRSGVIGALFGTVGICILGYAFSFVVKYSVKYSVIYGSLATLMFSFIFLSYFWKIVFAAVTMAYVHQNETVGFKEAS